MTLAVEKFSELAASRFFKVDGFIDVVGEVYKVETLEDRTLRNALPEDAIRNVKTLVANEQFMKDNAEIAQARDLAADLVRQNVIHHMKHSDMLKNNTQYYRNQLQNREAEIKRLTGEGENERER